MFVRTYSTKESNNSRINEIIQDISNSNTFKIAFTHKSYLKLDPSSKSYETGLRPVFIL